MHVLVMRLAILVLVVGNLALTSVRLTPSFYLWCIALRCGTAIIAYYDTHINTMLANTEHI